jgi:hypothetical protein
LPLWHFGGGGGAAAAGTLSGPNDQLLQSRAISIYAESASFSENWLPIAAN